MKSLTLLLLLAPSAPVLAAPNGSDALSCRALAQTVSRPRWLSLPGSRLVVNPHLENPPPAPGFSDPALALNLAAFFGETPTPLPGFWAWQPQADNSSRLVSGPRLDFSPASSGQWQAAGVTPEFGENGARLTVAAGASYGGLTRTVTVNLDKTPFLTVQTAGGTGGWALKVNDGTARTDTPLVQDTMQRGTFAADVRTATGWRGTKTFKVVLFATGGAGKDVTATRLQFFGRPVGAQFAPGKTTWFPHQIVTRATASTLEADSATALLDAATIAQRLHIRRAGAAAGLRLTGQFTAGRVAWDAAQKAVTLRGEQFEAVLTLNRPARWLGVKASGLDWLTGEGTTNAPSGVWALALDGVKTGEDIVVTAHFAPTTAAAQAGKPTSAREFDAALRRQEAAWDKRLQAVPRPQNFALNHVVPMGVTPADARRMYGAAWVFLFANILPPMPENGFPYPQCAAGKPSLWSEGSPHARASAQWESFLAMQALALADPETAWDACEGMLSLAGPDGSLNGEGLPSCHAQTAWVLFQTTGETARLRLLYPNLKRLLLWKASDPRWIYKNSTPPGVKDNEFVVHALTDMEYAARIASALKMPDEAAFWQKQRAALAANFHRWFWETPNGPLFRLYQTSTGQRTGPNNSWNLQALALPPDILTPAERDSLLASCKAQWTPGLPFFIPGLTRFPNYELTHLGLRQYGAAADAGAMAEAAMRDVTRAGEFSEVYDQNVSPPRPGGVWPSVFGARHIIDGSLWHNGIVADEGLPVLLGGAREGGGADVRVRGESLQIRFASHQQVTLDGPALKHLRLPGGFRAVRQSNGTTQWRGGLKAGARLALQAKA